MNKTPAFQFYPGDWLSSTRISLMTPAEEGAYIRLLCHAWNDPACSLPDDDKVLAVLSRLGEAWFSGSGETIRRCFKKKRGRLYSARLKSERLKQISWREKSRKGGIESGLARKNKGLGLKGGSDLVKTKNKPKGNSSVFSLQSSSSKNKERTSQVLRLSTLLADLILKNNPEHRDLTQKKDQTIQRWAGDIDKLIRLDERTPEDIEVVIRWCQADGFWQGNILSGAKLRAQWDTLKAQMKALAQTTAPGGTAWEQAIKHLNDNGFRSEALKDLPERTQKAIGLVGGVSVIGRLSPDDAKYKFMSAYKEAQSATPGRFSKEPKGAVDYSRARENQGAQVEV